MTLDPKYASLPWIAHGQPDLYEAGSLPESDQKCYSELVDTIMPKEIEVIKLSVNDAYKRFEKCKVDSTNVDFSDSISGNGKIGYAIESEEYDLLPPNSREHESLLKKFQRLQTELHQLMGDVNLVKDQTNVDSKESLSVSDLLHLSESLNNQLQELKLNVSNDEEVVYSSNSSPKALHKNILKQIEEFKPEKPTARTVEKSAHLIYEIYDRPTAPKLSEVERLADIDRRIQRIEALIGQPDPVRLSALTADTMQHSLLEACSRLAARSSLFQPSHLDMVDARLAGLQNKLQSVTEKREVIADFDTQNKIAELYELVKKWNDVADSLPMIVERLTALKTIHEEASQFSQSMKSVESNQKWITENLQTYNKLLTNVENNVAQNFQVIKDNFATLEARQSK